MGMLNNRSQRHIPQISSYAFNVFFLSFQGELEKLNQSTDVINRRETELEVGNSSLRFQSVCVGFCKQQKEAFEQVAS